MMMDDTETDATDLSPEEQLKAARDEIVALVAERDSLKDQALRASAEAENTRRRLQREKEEAVTYAATGFARDMLSVADTLERALAALPAVPDETLKPLLSGLEGMQKEMRQVFERHGITRVEAMGLPLDPMSHQAMVEVESDAVAGTVVSELQAGYRMKDRLLRPALVSVAKARAEAGAC